MSIQDTLSFTVSAVPLLARPAGCSSRHSSGNKKLLILYIREYFPLYINCLREKYSYLIGNFDLKLPIKIGSFKGKTSIVWARI
ncbi:uncharacterized protein METZ01_LOCUS407709 [marine metagenome]|uniref:Uncharacterized protein n=1 Tax=marine metagenome TaxID=408172 RepID=A0A382W939_9ZZZZ